jgi:hypothetical protein
MRFLTPTIFAAVAIAHFIAYLSLVAHAVALDAFSETLPATQSFVVGVLGLPLMPLSKMVAGSMPAVVSLAVANSLLWAACFAEAVAFCRGGWRRRGHKNA